MREILFRAKAINRDPNYEYRTDYQNGDWVYGLITKLYDERFSDLPAEMSNEDGVTGIEIDYRTIGQYTGLTDKNVAKIFEGDIVKYGDTINKVVFEQRNGTAYFGVVMDDTETWSFCHLTSAEGMEVIGNIHDNPNC